MTQASCRIAGLSRLKVWSAAIAMAAVATQAHGVVVHNYSFNTGNGTEVLDSVGNAHGTVIGGGTVATSEGRLVLDGIDDYVSLPGATIAVNTYTQLSLEMWLTVSPSRTNQFTMAVGFGRTADGTITGETASQGYDYIMLQPTRGPGGEGSRAAITPTNFATEAGVTQLGPDLSDGLLHHIVATMDSTNISYYVDGAPIGTAPMQYDNAGTPTPISLSDVSNDLAYLGRSLYNDPYLAGSLFEFRIHNTALDAAAVESAYSVGCTGCGTGPALEVNRDTGAVRLTNDLGSQSVVIYNIGSVAGAINPSEWDSIANTGDADSGGTIDADDFWEVTSSETTLISERNPIGAGGPSDGAPLNASLPLGNLWVKSPYEDLTASVTVLDASFNESTLSLPVFYVGNGGESFSRSDFNVDGDIDADDYQILLTNHLKALTGDTAIETFGLGDVDGDLDNDFDDWRLFKSDFIAANGPGAFAALSGAVIPEPSTFALASLAAVVLLGRRSRRFSHR